MQLASLVKSLQVIELLSKNPNGLSLWEMSTALGFPKSTIHHILNTFLTHDYVAQDAETRKYFLGFKFLSISKALLDGIDVRRIASRHLRKLHEITQETVHLAVLRDGKVIYIDKIEKPGGLSLATYIGFSTEPHAAAGGKVLLSEMSPEEVAGIYRERPMRPYGKNTLSNLQDLLHVLKQIQRQGYAVDDEEYYEGVRCVAAPIRAGGEMVAAVSVTGSVFTMTMERIQKELIPLVREAAEGVSSQMRG